MKPRKKRAPIDAPTAQELRDYMARLGLTNEDVREYLRLKDPTARQVRRWLAGEAQMTHPQWYTLVNKVKAERQRRAA